MKCVHPSVSTTADVGCAVLRDDKFLYYVITDTIFLFEGNTT